MTTPQLRFHGAAGEVTGSMHMLRLGQRWIAIDCGLHQGRRSETEAKNRTWPMPPKDISAVILSHAHIDHAGRLPKLVRDGFDGDVFCTPATRDLCAIMLADSAHIQEEDVHYVNKKRRRKGLEDIEPLYEHRDAVGAIKLMHTVSYDRWVQAAPGLMVRFQDAGHMLGSAGIELRFSEAHGGGSLFYTGDIGRNGQPILRDPRPLPNVDWVICESTYGGRLHEEVEDAKRVLTDVVKRTVARKGKVIIPSFSVGRTQTLVYFLHQQMVTGELPRIPVYVDSPLAVNATEVFRMHPECYDAEARAFQRVTSDILGSGVVTYIRDVEQSKALHRKRRPMVIISASGMVEFGRIRHHVKNNVRSKKNTILIPGFQAEHTLGRRLADGATSISLFHQRMPVRAEVVQLHGFSGHADQRELLAFLRPHLPGLRGVFLTHGEPDQTEALAEQIRAAGGRRVESARPGLVVELNGSGAAAQSA